MSSALQVYALCVVVLFLKMFLVSCYQGYHRLRFVAFTNPEDAAVFRRIAQAAERPQVIRAAKVWANDLENIPMFFALGGLAVALEAATLPVLWLSVVFTVARVLHTLAYLRGLQPWRTLFYGIGVICLLGFCSLITARIGG
ncbi:glutathione metabolism protein [Pseudomonas putida JB]|jgi:prostaglandin-E synthase 1|uniref:MAPEG family protein n=1 Tax=Pseudomonas TaxID=286 RepID=UPI0001F31FDC|nr:MULTISPECIES: MAPEG family protein [Pseudomonas]ADR60634.1 Membrane-associated protein in eicosanoid and glutathione metabolism (MAPEG) [Pseudomonas putida BIRD-1]AOX08971.1 glutathione metabolism protein [Pseudomonas putida JB]MCI1022784.1 MAPEG family protein [Pseudomonas putida]MDN4512259.1 MAPEG family protein [Pseudomonas sp. 2,4-D]PWY46746.1 MAPEG family protein [Pseudomonas sp. RW405]